MSDLTFTIRPAVPEDLDPLWAMVGRAVARMNTRGNEQWGEDYPTRAHYVGDIISGRLWVAAGPRGQVYGAALITDEEEESYRAVDWAIPGPAVVLHRMAVDPNVQRSGVGAALFRHAEALARDMGIPVMHIDTYGKNQAMQALILSRGFVKRGEIHLHGRPLAFPCFEKVLD